MVDTKIIALRLRDYKKFIVMFRTFFAVNRLTESLFTENY